MKSMRNAELGMRNKSKTVIEAKCLGCGCTDSRACLPLVGDPCHWLRVDYKLGIGVCSECPEKIEEFEKKVMASRGTLHSRQALINTGHRDAESAEKTMEAKV